MDCGGTGWSVPQATWNPRSLDTLDGPCRLAWVLPSSGPQESEKWRLGWIRSGQQTLRRDLKHKQSILPGQFHSDRRDIMQPGGSLWTEEKLVEDVPGHRLEGPGPGWDSLGCLLCVLQDDQVHRRARALGCALPDLRGAGLNLSLPCLLLAQPQLPPAASESAWGPPGHSAFATSSHWRRDQRCRHLGPFTLQQCSHGKEKGSGPSPTRPLGLLEWP